MKYYPKRMCIACRERKVKDNLIKIVKVSDELVIANTHTEGSRGLYICKDINCINLAIKKKVLNRVLKKEIDVSFYEKLKDYCSGEQN